MRTTKGSTVTAAEETPRFSLVSPQAQRRMLDALNALAAKKSAAQTGAEIVEIAAVTCLEDSDVVVFASAALGARQVRPGKARLASNAALDGDGRFLSATSEAVAGLVTNTQAVAVVCAGAIDSDESLRRALEFASLHKLPIIYLVANQFATGKRLKVELRTLPAEMGVPVFSVDANDAIAAYRVMTEALHNARHHVGPCVIEALTLKNPEDPIQLLRSYMERHGVRA